MNNLGSAKTAAARKTAKKMGVTLTIKIEGKSADKFFAVGPIDIRDHFLAAGFGTADFSPADVKSIKFTKTQDVTYRKRVKAGVHRDNF